MKLAYRKYGEGKAIVILHGLFGQSDNWNTLAKNFSEQGFCVYTLDQRNHGLSPHSNDWNYELMARDLKEFLDDHVIESPILLGHSMGAKTVLFFECLFPGLASKIVIADMAARAYAHHHQLVLKALNAVNFETIKTRKEAEAVLNEYISDFGTKQFLLKNIYWKDSENTKMDWRFNLAVISKHYHNISVGVPPFISKTKALVIKGEKSDYILDEDVENYQQRFSDVIFSSIPNSGHWVHAEKPKEFFDCVMAFIKDEALPKAL